MPRSADVAWDHSAVDRVTDALGDGLQEWADLLLEASQAEVPVLTGQLRSTGQASVDRDELQAAVSYDGPEAIVQHEAMSYRHPGGGKAKYLEQPAHATYRQGAQALADRVRRALR